MNTRGFLEESIPDLDAGLQSYPNPLPESFALRSATDGMLLYSSLKGSVGLANTGATQSHTQGDDPYPASFLEEQTMVPQTLAHRASGGKGYAVNPYTIAPPAPISAAVDPGLLAATSAEEPSISRMPSLTTADLSESIASRIPTVERPQSKSSRSISDGIKDPPFADPPAKKKKTQSKTMAASAATKTTNSRKTSPDANIEDDSKRNTVLERNRVAALKCRKKKKEFVQDLEEQCVELETTHHALQTEAQGLLNELNSMKNHLMDHASCKDPRIDNWLECEAQRFVRESKERAMREQGVMEGGLTYEKLIETVAPTTVNVSSHRSSLSESRLPNWRQSRQGSAGSSQAAGMPVCCRPSHPVSEGAWNSTMELPVYGISSVHTSPSVPPYSTLEPLADEEG